MFAMKRAAWLVGVIFTAAIAATGRVDAKTKLDWNPEKTSVFVVGILEWQHADIWSSFPECQPNRRDRQLVEHFREAGVPEDRIVYLCDSQATKHRIQQAFAKLLDQTEDGDLLIFYFCGHGYRDADSGQTWFANYDAGQRDSSAWSVPSIFATIEKRFHGSRALLLADCCHSGALYDEALKHRDSHIKYAALTSSYSHNTSTGNWTFSDCLLAGLRGEAVVDLNDDQIIELDELAQYSELELAFIEGQKAMFTSADTFPRHAHLAYVEDEVKPGVGQRVEVESDGKWYKAKIIDVDGDQFEVHYVHFDDSWDEWVGHDRIRPYQPAQFAAGDKVDVQWQTDEKWYPATVLKAWYGLELVRYDGYDSSSDEWVGSDSVRLRTE
jgi:Caspase domain/Agenet domain